MSELKQEAERRSKKQQARSKKGKQKSNIHNIFAVKKTGVEEDQREAGHYYKLKEVRKSTEKKTVKQRKERNIKKFWGAIVIGCMLETSQGHVEMFILHEYQASAFNYSKLRADQCSLLLKIRVVIIITKKLYERPRSPFPFHHIANTASPC